MIDADLLLEQYNLKDATKYGNKDIEQQAHSYGTMMLYEIADMIEDAPTAYDPDKVVEQLKELKEAYRKKREHTRCRLTETDDCDRCRADHYLEARISTIDKVIDIVKGGGVNE